MDAIVLTSAAEVGGVIRAARMAADLSQIELAERLGTVQSAVSRWERGHDEPRLSTLIEIMASCNRRLMLSVEHVHDDPVDLAQIRRRLVMSPAERLESAANMSAMLASARPVS